MIANSPKDQAATHADRRLAGQVVLVTGASRGLGLMVAESFAGHGAAVGLVARSTAPLEDARDKILAEGGSAVAVTASNATLAWLPPCGPGIPRSRLATT